jgi:ParB-like chromosome segregation protein Spo0J
MHQKRQRPGARSGAHGAGLELRRAPGSQALNTSVSHLAQRRYQICEVEISRIIVGKRLRQATDAQLEVLVESTADIDIRTPVSVRFFDRFEHDGVVKRNVYVLLAGARRLAATKRHGAPTILAIVEMDDPEIGRLPIADIAPVERLSVSAKERVAKLVQRVQVGGALDRLRVRPTATGFEVAADPHLLEAAQRLGHAEIDVLIVGRIDDLLWECDENLCRAELSAAEIAEHVATRKELWERKRRYNSGASCTTIPRGPGRPKEFAAETAKATGRDKSTITRALARGKKLAPDVIEAVKGTALDTGASLDKLAKLPVEEQRQAAKSGLLPLALPPTTLPANPTKMPAYDDIVAILQRHIPLEERRRLLALSAGLPAGTSFAMVIRAAQTEGGAG